MSQQRLSDLTLSLLSGPGQGHRSVHSEFVASPRDCGVVTAVNHEEPVQIPGHCHCPETTYTQSPVRDKSGSGPTTQKSDCPFLYYVLILVLNFFLLFFC